MIYKQLGKSALHISRIGFGCMSIKPGHPSPETMIDAALAAGINYFDTADLYDKGWNETMLGKALLHKRDQAIVATKVGNQWRADGTGWDWNPSKGYIISSVEQSLMRLGTDYIDLYQLHGGTINDPIDESIEAFELLVQQGKIRYYGISSIRPNVIRAYVERSNIVSVMMQYSLLDRRPEESCLALLEENIIGVLARGTVASGLLGGKPATEYLGHPVDEVAKAAKLLKDPAAASAIAFVLNNEAITSAVVGMRTTRQLQDALAAIDHPLSKEAADELALAVPATSYSEHR